MKPNPTKPLKTYKNRHGTMKTQSGTSKLTWSWTGWLWGVQVVTGDSQEEVIIFHYKQNCIIIYISTMINCRNYYNFAQQRV